jgi:hypothetical protein
VKVETALGFLRDQLFVSQHNLCREDLGSYSERYWTCSDNMLACRAFELMGELTYKELIQKRLQSIMIPCVAEHDSTTNHFHDPIITKTSLVDPPCDSDCYVIDTSNWTASSTPCPNYTVTSGVFHEDHKKGNPFPDYAAVGLGKGYANICFLEAISYKNAGQSEKARSLYRIGMDKWDQKGRGFNDSAYASSTTPKPTFDAYKLALCIIASQIVNGNLPRIYEELDAQLASQQGENGGINSQFTATTNQTGSENCETTAMTIIAYKLSK